MGPEGGGTAREEGGHGRRAAVVEVGPAEQVAGLRRGARSASARRARGARGARGGGPRPAELNTHGCTGHLSTHCHGYRTIKERPGTPPHPYPGLGAEIPLALYVRAVPVERAEVRRPAEPEVLVHQAGVAARRVVVVVVARRRLGALGAVVREAAAVRAGAAAEHRVERGGDGRACPPRRGPREWSPSRAQAARLTRGSPGESKQEGAWKTA